MMETIHPFRQLRIQTGMSLIELSKLSKIAIGTLRAIETFSHPTPYIVVEKVCCSLGIRVEEMWRQVRESMQSAEVELRESAIKKYKDALKTGKVVFK